MIQKIPREFVSQLWPFIEGHVKRTCAYHPFMESEDVRSLLERDMATLFVSVEHGRVIGFGVLEVVEYPRLRVANILGAGGESGFLSVAINELLPFMIEHGKTQGATVVTLSGRPGWLRALRHLNGRSQRFITWWADIDEQGRRKVATGNHARAVETSAAIPN